MKWVKANWLIVVLSVVALAALPTMFFFSSKLSKGLRDQVQKEAGAAVNDVSSASVTYSIPDVKRPDTKLFEKSTDVNEILTKKIADAREAIKREGSLLGAEAVKFNQGSHQPLVNGLFPSPGSGGISQKYQFAREFIENMPKRVLESVGARGPIDAARLAGELSEYKKAREERMRAVGGAGAADPDEAEKIREELLATRLDRYRTWAEQTTFYAEWNSAVFNDVPTGVPNPLPPMSRLWDWQLRAWIYQDLMKAFATANANAAGGGEANVLGGVLKRVIKIAIQNQDYVDTPDDTPPEQMTEGMVPVEVKNPVSPDMTQSVSGRYSGPTTGNQHYDMRTATIEMIVAPDKLPYLFDAMSQTNFMTVLKIEMEPADVLDDLTKGYFYGNDHVVKATMTVETVWLRDWTKQYMPRSVRASLGIQEPQPTEGGELPPQ